MSEKNDMLDFCENLVDKITTIKGFLSLSEKDNSQPYLEETRKELINMAETITSFIENEFQQIQDDERCLA